MYIIPAAIKINRTALTMLMLSSISFYTTATSAAESGEIRDQIVALDAASPQLRKTLLQALATRGDSYQPRTEHLRKDGSPVYLNRLIKEDSPYLIQHAHNPVNWYPWGEEAFTTAKQEDKPVFLSIGYATCHWCHVMERESFENEEIASILNEHFISIKVDREQRPDVDTIYMTAVQMIAGRGGWPMSSWLTASGKPFYGGTYFRPNDFTRLLHGINELWRNERSELLTQSEQLSAAIEESNRLQGEVSEVTTREVDNALRHLLSVHDDLQGGFSEAPKFPMESTLFLLLEEARRNGNPDVLSAAHFTLQQMAAGGIHDQIGGGFHRYSVDNEWLVPHFEKMLYNQAALSRNYVLAFQQTGDPEHARTVRRTLDYVIREMTSPAGGFYSATDADSDGAEGRFFIWSPAELSQILGEQDAKRAMAFWQVSEDGNFSGKNILHLDQSITEVAKQNGLPPKQLTALLDDYSNKLLAARVKRIPPLLDDKIITQWNAMMITAFTQAADALDEPRYYEAALRAAEFIWSHNRKENGGFWRAHFAGSSSIDASQSDYAYLAEALLALYDSTHENAWLEKAIELADTMEQKFWDTSEGGYFIGAQVVAGAALPTRPKDIYDNATPSGNAVALRVLTRLWHRTGEERFRERAEELLSAFSPYLAKYPSGFGYFLTAAAELLSGETGSQLYAARGKVSIHARQTEKNRVSVDLRVAPGWHINADKPLQEYLIGTSLTAGDGSALKQLRYPEAKRQVLGFERSELALYDGNVTLSSVLPQPKDRQGSLVSLALNLQACNDEVCLPPETIPLKLSVAVEGVKP